MARAAPLGGGAEGPCRSFSRHAPLHGVMARSTGAATVTGKDPACLQQVVNTREQTR